MAAILTYKNYLNCNTIKLKNLRFVFIHCCRVSYSMITTDYLIKWPDRYQ